MTARDDFDRLLSAWFDDDAPGREPEHLLGQVLARTARTRRRPGWLVPERWLSVQLVTRWQTVPRVAPLVVALGLLLALLAAALLLSGRPRLPAPFGPAANGLIAYMSGPQIVVAPIGGSDPRPLTPAADVAGEPVFSPLGRRIAYKLFEFPQSAVRSALYTAISRLASRSRSTRSGRHRVRRPGHQTSGSSSSRNPRGCSGAIGSSSSRPTPRLPPGRSARTATPLPRCSHPTAGRSRSS